MSDDEQPDLGPGASPTTWRREHPVLSRALLYGCAGLLAAVLVVLLQIRRQDDAAAEIEKQRREMENLSIVLLQDPTGEVCLEVLDERFPLKELPAELVALRHRMTALAYRRGGELTQALALLDRARTAAQNERERLAVDLERAETLILSERFDDARALTNTLEHPAAAGDAGILLAALLRAETWALQNQRDAAWESLDGVLAGLRPPLAAGQSWEVGGHAWTATEAAYKATARLARWAPGQSGPWLRLAELGEDDLQIQIEAARGLLAGNAEEAACQVLEGIGPGRDSDVLLYVGHDEALIACAEKCGLLLKATPAPAR